MKPSKAASIVPGVVVAVCALMLAYLLASSSHVRPVEERIPNLDRQPGQVASEAEQPAASQPSPADTVQSGPQPAAPAGTVTASAPGTATAAAIAGSWPSFRGANYENVSTETTPLADRFGKGEPKVLWSLNLGEGHAGAAVLNGRVYLIDYDQAAQSDTIMCLSFADGSEIWRYSYPVVIKRNHGISRTVPAVTDKYVVTIGPKCHLACLDAGTGRLLWQKDLVREFGTTIPPWYAGQCPMIDGGRVIVAPGGSALMAAIDCATGKVLWQTPNPLGWKMTHSSIVPMTAAGKRTYIYCASGGVVGVDAASGKQLWQTDEWRVKIANIPTPVVVGSDRLFLTGGYGSGCAMLKLNGSAAPSVVSRLKPEVFGSDQQTPVLYKGYIYGVIPGGQLACLTLDGKRLWTSGTTRFGLGPYVIADDKIYALSDTGLLAVVQATNAGYKQLAQSRILTGSDAWAPIAVAGGRLIARDLTRMVCLDIGRR